MDKETRTLRIEIPAVLLGKEAIEEEWSGDPNISAFNGWQILFPGSLPVYWEGTIDLSGYARDYKTFTPAGGVLQEGAYSYEAGSGGTIVFTIISSTPLEASNVYYQVAALSGPGLLTGLVGAYGEEQQNFNQILFAESTMLVPNVNIAPNAVGILQPLTTKQTGSISATAAEVLYCMKMVIPFAQDQTTLGIPASRVLLIGDMVQEPELEYMMRLSRSVQLANQV